MSRIGFFSGTFDPVHKGHIAFALESIKAANLDKVLFLPEARPRRKDHVTHFGHRTAMLRLGVRAHRNLDVLELPDKQFTVAQTLPRLEKLYPDDELFLLLGSDVISHLKSWDEWPHADTMLSKVGLIVGLRGEDSAESIAELENQLPGEAKELTAFHSPELELSSRHIREAIASNKVPDGLLPSVQKYIGTNWLYHTPPRH